MKTSPRYVLVFDQQLKDGQQLTDWLGQLMCPAIVVSSTEQVMMATTQTSPCLVILVGSHESLSQQWIKTLRKATGGRPVTIVALTDSHSPPWLPQDENPGLDGFLVKPLSRDVLTSLVQSAWLRQAYFCPAS